MTKNEILEKINIDEFNGEKLISKFRLFIAFIFFLSVPAVSIMRGLSGDDYFPPVSYICCSAFLFYSFFIYFYLRKIYTVKNYFKYICVIIDMLIHTGSIWIGCLYPETAPAISYLSTWALFFFVLITTGAFRYSVRCAYFSGVFAGLCYLLVVIINADNLDLPYFFIFENKAINVSFPVFNESFRAIAMIITGIITGMACKRHLKQFISMIESQSEAADTALNAIKKTRSMTEIIQESTDKIFLSSKDIFTTANNQAASVQEIESTLIENSKIAKEIAVKTSSVASVALKMENDVIHGFSLLERNIEKLSDIKSKNDGVIKGIISLGNKIIKIREIIMNINTITDQTKVIAFNAALEAANAEEKGLRFAVVAGEVNRLAGDIASLTRQICANIEEIEKSSSSLVISGGESADKITEGNNLIKELEKLFRDILSEAENSANKAQAITVSTQKQLKSAEHINKAMTNITAGLSYFIKSTKLTTSSAENLANTAEKLGEILKVTENPGNNYAD